MSCEDASSRCGGTLVPIAGHFHSKPSDDASIDGTNSNALTGTPASGWTLNNDRHQRLGTALWSTQSGKPLVEINGIEANDPNATGKPAITGTAQQGQTARGPSDYRSGTHAKDSTSRRRA